MKIIRERESERKKGTHAEESGEDLCQKKRLRVDAKVGYEWRQTVFSSVTEHAAAKTHQL